MRERFLTGKVFESIADAQAQLDAWVKTYNEDRPHQSIGHVPPIRRFELRQVTAESPRPRPTVNVVDTAALMPAGATRRVSRKGTVSFGAASYVVGQPHVGLDVLLVMDRKLVNIYHDGVLIRTHARKHAPAKQGAALNRQTKPRPAPVEPALASATLVSVTRKVDSSGNVCFAGENYYVGAMYKRRQVQVAVIGDTIEISVGKHLIRSHPARHDRTREHGALANPGGRARRINAA